MDRKDYLNTIEEKRRTFQYMPRITIAPNHYEEERIEELVLRCKEYDYDEVMFFINNENLFRGFLSTEEIKPNVEMIKRAKARLAKEGIATSLNPWTTLGHGTYGQQSGFYKMVGDKGFASPLTPCPLDEEWQEYIADYYAYLVREIHPKIIWVEDDLRLGNHDLSRFGNDWEGGCFCERHMKMYSEALGKQVTREEFVKCFTQNSENGKYRKVYYEINRRTFREIAEKIGSACHAEDEQTQIGLMSAGASSHMIEGRDWHGMLYGLSGKNKPVSRISLPMYRQLAAQDYGWVFNAHSMSTRALLPEETEIFPELENAKFSPFCKSRNMTRFQIESSLAMCPSGITLDKDCFCGNGLVAAYGYGEPLKEIKSYLSAFVDCGIPYSSIDGVIIPISEDTLFHLDSVDSINALNDVEHYWGSHLSSVGVACAFRKKEAFKKKIVGVAGSYLRGLSDEEIKDLFANNFLLLDGDSVKILFQRNLNHLIRATSYRTLNWRNGECSFEQAAKGKRYLNMNGARVSATVVCPQYLQLEYSEEPTVYTEMYGFRQEYIGPALVSFDNCFIFPYMISENALYASVPGKFHGLLSTMRTEALQEALRTVKLCDTPVVYHNMPYVSTYYYRGEKYDYLLLVNFSDDGYGKEICIEGLPSYKKAWVCSRENGEWQEAALLEGRLNTLDGLKPTASVFVRLEKI